MKKRFYEPSGDYAGMADRKEQERMDGSMLHEDHSQIANLPQQVMFKTYPRNPSTMPEGLDDTLRGIDRQIDLDDSKKRRYLNPKKV